MREKFGARVHSVQLRTQHVPLLYTCAPQQHDARETSDESSSTNLTRGSRPRRPFALELVPYSANKVEGHTTGYTAERVITASQPRRVTSATLRSQTSRDRRTRHGSQTEEDEEHRFEGQRGRSVPPKRAGAAVLRQLRDGGS